jgi:CubicO group peptidase (beta-lactamase class C family)
VHLGGTGGYRSYAGFDKQARVGIVVLTNLSNEVGIRDIGRHLLDPAFPLAKVVRGRHLRGRIRARQERMADRAP